VSEVSVLTYRHLVEGIPAVLYVDGNDDRSSNLYTSPQIEPLLGFTVEQWRDDPALWFERIHEDDRERVLEEHRRSMRTGEPFRTEYRLLAGDGREVWIRDEAVLIRGAEHDPPFWRGVMTDITRTKLVEGRLRTSMDVLRRTTEDRRQLLVRLEDAQEEERRRIASDIHDDPIQVMSAADIRAEMLARQIEDPDLRQEAEDLRDVIRSSVERLRHLLFELRPPALEREGLVPALRACLGDEDPVTEIEDALPLEPPPEP
jgi:PAS domain S-box-containing protein